MLQELKIGDEVNWLYEPRGGYGYVTPVAGVVTKIGPQKVQIRVAKRVDGQWAGMRRWVRPERLTRRVGSAGEAERILNGESEQVSQPASKKRETEINMDTARRIAGEDA